jgi:hypothetical protein
MGFELRKTIAFFSLLLLLGSVARGEIVVLKNDSEIEGRVIRIGDLVRIEIKPGATIILKTSEIKSIRTGSFNSEFGKKIAALKSNDAEGHYQLALWCIERDLKPQSNSQLNKVLKLSPKHPGALSRISLNRKMLANAKDQVLTDIREKRPSIFRRSSTHIKAISWKSDWLARRAVTGGEAAVKKFAAYMELKPDDTRLMVFDVNVKVYGAHAKFLQIANIFGGSHQAFYSYGDNTCYLNAAAGLSSSTIRHEVGHALLWRVCGVAPRVMWLQEGMATLLEGQGNASLSIPRLWYAARYSRDIRLSIPDLLRSRFNIKKRKTNLLSYSRVWCFTHFIFHGGNEKLKKRFLKFIADCQGYSVNSRAIFAKHFPQVEWPLLEKLWRGHINLLIRKHLRWMGRVSVPATVTKPKPIATRRRFLPVRATATQPARVPARQPAQQQHQQQAPNVWSLPEQESE